MLLKVQMLGIPYILLNKATQTSLCTESRNRVDIILSISEGAGFRPFSLISSRLSFEANTKIIPEIRLALFPTLYFRIHNLLILPSVDVINLNYVT
jgi:hypothetical protein